MSMYLNYFKPLFYAGNLTISGIYFVPCFSNIFVIPLVILFWFSNLFPWACSFLLHNILVSKFYLWLNIDLVFLLRCSVSRSICEKSSLTHVSLRIRCWVLFCFVGCLGQYASSLITKKSPPQLNCDKKAPNYVETPVYFHSDFLTKLSDRNQEHKTALYITRVNTSVYTDVSHWVTKYFLIMTYKFLFSTLFNSQASCRLFVLFTKEHF